MPQFIDTVLSNPLYIGIAVILFVVLLYSVVKRVIKLILFIILAILAFLAYVHFTGGDVKDTLNKVKDKGGKLVN